MNKQTIYAIITGLIALVVVVATQFRSPTDTAPITSPIIPSEPIVVIQDIPQLPTPEPLPTTQGSTTYPFQYIAIHDGCNWNYTGACVNMRSGADLEFPVVAKLRDGMVLAVTDQVVVNDQIWYKIAFTDWMRYPERVLGDRYVADTDSVELFSDVGPEESAEVNASSTQRIIVDIGDQTLSAYDGTDLFMKEPISTGLEFTPTPRGTFFIFKKTPSRYMQGPLPGISKQYYDLPGVPWDLYFTHQGAVIHGVYWHDNFGERWSHGCVNLPAEIAHKLYYWANVGTPVVVQD